MKGHIVISWGINKLQRFFSILIKNFLLKGNNSSFHVIMVIGRRCHRTESFVSLGNLEELEAPGSDPHHCVTESEKDNETLCSNNGSLRING